MQIRAAARGDMQERIAIVLIQAPSEARDSLERALRSASDFSLLAVCDTGAEGIDAVETLTPDVVLLDDALPNMEISQALAAILAAMPTTAVIALLRSQDDDVISSLLASGLEGSVIKPIVILELFDKIRAIHARTIIRRRAPGRGPLPPPAVSPVQPTPPSPLFRGIPDELLEESTGTVPPPSPAPQAPISEAPAPKPPVSVHEVQFSAHYPREVKPNDWQPMVAYVFKQTAGPAVQDDVKKVLGNRTDIRSAERTGSQPIAEGVTITAAPYLPGFQFNPQRIDIGFYEDWHRFEFKLRANAAPLDQAANGRVTFTVEGIIIADVPMSIYVTANASNHSHQAEATTKPYQAVFCSYSHKDTGIIERVERAYKAIGMDYLRDVTTLKAGQEWNAELLKMIERADIFQLFWSENSAASKYVMQEWEHALNLRREGPFIRPVYWDQPMPKVPDPLRHLHFAYQPDLDD